MTAGVNRRLLASLACAPAPQTVAAPGWTRDLGAVVTAIRRQLSGAHVRNEESVSLTTLDAWHAELDTELTRAAHACPQEWSRWAWPGTWLDSHLRLRAVLRHLRAAAREQDVVPSAVAYADMDVAGFVWGACPAGTHLCWHDGKVVSP